MSLERHKSRYWRWPRLFVIFGIAAGIIAAVFADGYTNGNAAAACGFAIAAGLCMVAAGISCPRN